MSIQAIFNKCLSLGMTKAGAAGCTANILHESGGRCNNLEDSKNRLKGISDEEYTRQVDAGIRNFIDDCGYGLCQWTADDRKEWFLKYMRQNGVSIADEKHQWLFMAKEMRETPRFQHTWLVLTTTDSPYEAGRVMCKEFEVPANTEATAKARGEEAERIFKECTGNAKAEEPKSTKTEFWPPRTLDKNMSGPDVEFLQSCLKARGYAINYISGKFDDLLEQEVKKFQLAMGLVVDGIVGPKTWAVLLGR